MNTVSTKSLYPDKKEFDYLKKVRRHLHRHPEPSGREEETAEFILSELKKTGPDRVLEGVGGMGVIAIYGDDEHGPQIMFRAELDALPITEKGEREHQSTAEGMSHACGHDGHMAAILGVARYLKKHRPEKGRVMILFQPSEETGEGACRIIEDPKFQKLNIDRSYAFHNLPGFEKGTIYYREGTFASASVGLQCRFEGESSHAAYPEQGRNPAGTLAKLVNLVQGLGDSDISSESYAIATVTYIQLGEKAFGISPGRAEMGITLRAVRDREIHAMRNDIWSQAEKCAEKSGLEWQIEENEPFVATVNSDMCIEIVKRAAKSEPAAIKKLDHPFPWSEDFGHFGDVSDIALIGIGAGVDHPHLHAEEFDFPDEILPQAITIFINIMHEEWSN